MDETKIIFGNNCYQDLEAKLNRKLSSFNSIIINLLI